VEVCVWIPGTIDLRLRVAEHMVRNKQILSVDFNGDVDAWRDAKREIWFVLRDGGFLDNAVCLMSELEGSGVRVARTGKPGSETLTAGCLFLITLNGLTAAYIKVEGGLP
jgi:hypothetical protein